GAACGGGGPGGVGASRHGSSLSFFGDNGSHVWPLCPFQHARAARGGGATPDRAAAGRGGRGGAAGALQHCAQSYGGGAAAVSWGAGSRASGVGLSAEDGL